MTVKPPKKMVKVDGIMMLNPEYKDWKEAQESGGGGGVQPSAPPEAQMAATGRFKEGIVKCDTGSCLNSIIWIR